MALNRQRPGFLCLAIVSCQLTAAFIPTIGYSINGFLGTSHTSITQTAVEAVDLEFFPVTALTVSMRHARDEIAAANAKVDETDEHNAPSHFDGESFPAGQERLIALRKQAKTALAAGDAATGRQAVGQALHTLQDFYSHTNWIELGHPDINRNILGLESGVDAIPRPDQSAATCQNCTTSLEEQADFTSRDRDVGCQNACKMGHAFSIPCVLAAACDAQDCSKNLLGGLGLTSGYYSDEGAQYTKPGPHKCSHGGIFDGSAFGTEGINKDSTILTLSPHAELHGQAVTVAIEATKDFFRTLKNDPGVTPDHIRLLLGAGPTLAFAIDTTGSMEDVISSVRAEAISIVNSKLGTPDEPILYVLSQIQDPANDLIETYTLSASFKAAINDLSAAGGDDCPELAMSAIYNALQALSEGGSLFVYTDAAAKDVELATAVAELARKKRVKVYTYLLPGECSSSAGFDLLAQGPGGQLFGLSDTSDAGDATTLAGAAVSANAVDIMSVDTSAIDGGSLLKRRQASPAHFSIPVDSAMSQISFSLSGTAARLQVKRPDGNAVSTADSGVAQIDFIGGQLITISTPRSGMWSVDIVGNASYSLSVSGASSLSLSSFQYVELRGRPGHEGFFPVNGTPPAGSNATVLAQIDGNFSEAGFEYRSPAGDVMRAIHLAHGGGNADDPVASNIFYGNVTVPSSNFTVYVVGQDRAGAPFQRVLPATFIYSASNGTNITNATTSSSTASPSTARASSSSTASLSNTSPLDSIPSLSRSASLGSASSSSDTAPSSTSCSTTAERHHRSGFRHSVHPVPSGHSGSPRGGGVRT